MLRWRHTWTWAIFSLLLVPDMASAQGRITLDVDRRIAAQGEPITVTVEIRVAGQQGYDEYRKPRFEGFVEEGGGMSSRNVSIVNMDVSIQEQYMYRIYGVRDGQLTVGPAAIVINGKAIESNRITVQIKGGAAPQPQPPGTPATPNAPTTPDDENSPPPDLDTDQPLPSVFVHGTGVPLQVYEGQESVLTWRIYTQSDLRREAVKPPALDAFWSEDLQSPRMRADYQRQIVQQQVYYVADLVRKAVFPQKTGTITVEPLEVRVQIVDGFFVTGSKVLKSNPLTLEVLPLPKTGMPLAFPRQNVGKFELMATLDRSEVSVGDAVRLTLVVRGQGNLRQLELPKPPRIDGVKWYDPKVSDKLNLDHGVAGEKIVEYLLIPTQRGDVTIPEMALNYFDPEQKQYLRAQTPLLTFRVKEGSPTAQPTTKSTGAKENVLKEDIRPPRTQGVTSSRSVKSLTTIWLVVLLGFPIVIVLGIYAGGFARRYMSRETEGSRRKEAMKRIQNQWTIAAQMKRQGRRAEHYAAINAGVSDALKVVLEIVPEGMTRQEFTAVLRDRFGDEVSSDAMTKARFIEEVVALLDECDMARFAPTGFAQGAGSEDAIARAKQLVNLLFQRSA